MVVGNEVDKDEGRCSSFLRPVSCLIGSYCIGAESTHLMNLCINKDNCIEQHRSRLRFIQLRVSNHLMRAMPIELQVLLQL